MTTPATNSPSQDAIKTTTAVGSKNPPTFTPSMIVTATLFPAAASIISVACYILNDELNIVGKTSIGIISILIGVFIGAIAWLVGASFYRPYITIKRANVNEYQGICSAFDRLDEAIKVMDSKDNQESNSYKAACAHRDYVKTEIRSERHRGGFRWVNGFGYVYLWRRLHRAEEELINVDSVANVINIALHDMTRVSNSRIENSASLVNDLRTAIQDLEKSVVNIDNSTAKSEDPSLQTLNVKNGDANKQERVARSTIARTRNTINVFRDDSLEGVLLSRKYLFTVTLAMSYLAYVLLSLALIANVPPDAVIAAGTYYLVGAIIGLFTRLSQDADSPTVLQDHSLSGVRLLYLPMFSGLAAIGGVLITSLLSIAAAQAISNGGHPGGMNPAAAEAILTLFNLNQFPSGILIAALFGLSPNLLTSRLKQQADAYRADLKSIEGPGKR